MSSDSSPSPREEPRFGIEVDVDIVSGNQFFTGFSKNLSEGGIFVATDDLVPIGTLIEMSFTVPNVAHHFKTIGEVRWARETSSHLGPAGVGIQFLEVSRDQRQLLREVLRKVDTLFFVDEE